MRAIKSISERNNLALIIVLFVIIFVGDLPSHYGLIHSMLPDILIVGLLLYLVAKAFGASSSLGQRFEMPGILPVTASLGVYILSGLINKTHFPPGFVFAGIVFEYYVLFIVLLNMNFTEGSFRRLNGVLLVLCVIQIPAALIKLFVLKRGYFFGGPGFVSFGSEVAAGTFGRQTGSMGTTFPLIIIGFLFVFYLWQRKSSYLILIAGFIFFSYLTAKRAFPLVLPVFMFLHYCLVARRQVSSQFFLKGLFLACSIGIVCLVFGLILHPSLNPSREVGGKFDIRYALSHALDYETYETREGESTGRIASTSLILETYDKRGVLYCLFGAGPGTFVKSGLVESTFDESFYELGITYGVTGFIWIFAQTGILGVACYLWLQLFFFQQIFRFYKHVTEPYWKAIAGGLMGMVLVILFDFVGYSTDSIASKVIPATFFCVLAQILSIQKRTAVSLSPARSETRPLLVN
jgi:hypothetical protein